MLFMRTMCLAKAPMTYGSLSVLSGISISPRCSCISIFKRNTLATALPTFWYIAHWMLPKPPSIVCLLRAHYSFCFIISFHPLAWLVIDLDYIYIAIYFKVSWLNLYELKTKIWKTAPATSLVALTSVFFFFRKIILNTYVCIYAKLSFAITQKPRGWNILSWHTND